jgi:hypothetical protein
MSPLIIAAAIFTAILLTLRGYWSFAALLVARCVTVVTVVPYVTRVYVLSGVGSDATFYKQQVSLLQQGIIHVSFSLTDGTANIIFINARLQELLHVGPTFLTIFLQIPIVLISARIWRYARPALPKATRTFTLLVIAWAPSMVFWTSNYGKDTWVFLGSILILSGVLGAHHKRGGSPRIEIGQILAGVLVISAFKPYIALALVTGLLFRAGFGRTRKGRRVSLGRQLMKLSSLLLLTWIAFLLQRHSLGTGNGSLLNQIGQKADLLSSGGSALGLGSASSLGGLILRAPSSLIATFFRPSPIDAHSTFIWLVTLEVIAFWIGCILTTARVRHSDAISVDNQSGTQQVGRIGLIALLILGTALAPVLGNLGTLARVRVFDFPYLAFLPCYLAGLRSARAATTQRLRLAPATGRS